MSTKITQHRLYHREHVPSGSAESEGDKALKSQDVLRSKAEPELAPRRGVQADPLASPFDSSALSEGILAQK